MGADCSVALQHIVMDKIIRQLKDIDNWPIHGSKWGQLHRVQAGSVEKWSSDQDNGRSAKATGPWLYDLAIFGQAPSAWIHHASLLEMAKPKNERSSKKIKGIKLNKLYIRKANQTKADEKAKEVKQKKT